MSARSGKSRASGLPGMLPRRSRTCRRISAHGGSSLHAIRAGRPRIKVVWDFNSDRGEIEYLYPGDAYVDVISQDIYWIHDLQGTDPVDAFHLSRYGNQLLPAETYAWPLQRHFEWCKGKRKPMAISEWAVKLKDRPFQLNSTAWVQEFFNFIDYVNADPDVGMAYVSWWSNEEANVGSDGTNGFRDEAGEPHLTNVRNMFRARLPGTILGTGDNPPPPPPPDPDPTYPPVTTDFGTGPIALCCASTSSLICRSRHSTGC